MKKSLAVLGLAALIAPAALAADTWTIDKAHSEVSFQVRHIVTNVRGQFGDYDATIVTDAAKPESSSVTFRIKAASVDTQNEKRDAHLRTPDFFAVEQFPEITFKSTAVKPTGQDTFEVTGDFTLRGVTKQITVPVKFLGSVKDPWGNEKAGFEVATVINRKDYGVNWNKALDQGGFLLADEVRISINLEVGKVAPAAAPAK